MLMSTANQPEVFVAMFYIGFITGMLFDFFRSIRCVVKSLLISNFIDALFWVIFTILFVNELLDKNYGQFKFYCVIGVMVGWLLYYITVSRIVFQLFYTMTSFLSRVINRVFRPIRQVIKKINFYRACPEIFKERLKKGVHRITSK